MKTLWPALLAVLLALAPMSGLRAENAPTEDLSTGFLPAPWVNAALAKSLSPQGRASMVSPTGPVRITDASDRIDAARKAISQLQHAPALVPIELSFATQTRREVQRLPPEQPVVGYEIPVPNRYAAPRIMANPRGFTVVPAQPYDFRTRNAGPGDVVNPSPTGYQTFTPEVRMTETETTENIARRFSVSTVLGKPIVAPVLRQVADVAALQALALKYGAITADEPAWTAAGTELLLTPEASGAAVSIKIAPQIVLPPAAPGQAPRRIPLNACTAGVLIARGAQTTTGLLPKTDPEFYRIFLGSKQAVDDTFTAVTVQADVQYIGNPPDLGGDR